MNTNLKTDETETNIPITINWEAILETTIGKPVPKEQLTEEFPADEGSINMYYGMIGNGKTYAATADIISLLEQGKVVYANWHILVDDFDDRENGFILLINTLLFRKRFYKIPCAQNLYFFDVDVGCFNSENHMIAEFNGTQNVVEYFSAVTDAHIFWDEGQDMFDSYEGTKFSKAKRRLILHTRHFHRTINIISQRPTAIQVSARGNVNRFFKCVKIGSFFGRPRFARYEFQQMTGETVDEMQEPVSTRTYWGSNKVFNAYNTDYLADGIQKSQAVFFDAYDLNHKHKIWAWKQKFRNMFHTIKSITQKRKKDNEKKDVQEQSPF